MNMLDPKMAPGPKLFSDKELFATPAVQDMPIPFVAEMCRRLTAVLENSSDLRKEIFEAHGMPAGMSGDEVGSILSSMGEESVNEISDRLDQIGRHTLTILVWEIQAYALAAFKDALDRRYSSGQYPLNSPEAEAADQFSAGLCFLMNQVMDDFFLIGSAQGGNMNTAEPIEGGI